jgi:hypothetical protein
MASTVRLIGCIAVLLVVPVTSIALEPPAELLTMKMRTQLLTETTGTMTGEGVCWHASWRAGDFVRGARETGNQAYLDGAGTYLDALIAKMHTSPDGWRGWVGPYIYDSSVLGDVHIGDAILANHMLAFALYVRQELPAAQRHSYEVRAQAYIDLAQHIIDKWVARGTWYENGHYGGYVSWNQFLTAHNMGAFQQLQEVRNVGLSLPFNKQQSLGIMHLRLHRLTGDAEHLRKARLIFQYTRSRMSGFEDGFTWNYWEPFYPGDMAGVDPPRLAHWVGTHPYRDYQHGEVSEFVEAYDSGLVFTEADMARLVRTNLHMWNGDFADPQWVNSDRSANVAAVPGWTPSDPAAHGYPRSAGTLWHGLAAYDETLARLAGTDADNRGYERRAGVIVEQLFDWPLPQVTYLNLGCVLPASVPVGSSAYLVSKSRAAGDLRVVLTDGSGRTELVTLFDGPTTGGIDGIEGLAIQQWTADVEPGAYRVRWQLTVGEHREHRDYLITVGEPAAEASQPEL